MKCIRNGAAAFVVMATLALAGCQKAFPRPAILTLDDLLRRPPDASIHDVRIWDIQSTTFVHGFYAEIPNEWPMGYNLSVPMSLLVVTGEMDIRVGSLRRIIGPGSYISVPRYAPLRIRRNGQDRLMVAGFYASADKFQWSRLQAPLAAVK